MALVDADDLSGGLDAVHDRHPDVHQDDVGVRALGGLHRRLAVAGLPDHGHVGAVSTMPARPARSSTWSSATTTLITPVPRPSAACGRRVRDGKATDDLVSAAGQRSGPQRSAQDPGPFVHPGDAVARSTRRSVDGGPSSRTVIVSWRRRRSRWTVGAHRAGVLDDVRQRLLHDPVRVELDQRRQRRDRAAAGQNHVDARLAGPVDQGVQVAQIRGAGDERRFGRGRCRRAGPRAASASRPASAVRSSRSSRVRNAPRPDRRPPALRTRPAR